MIKLIGINIYPIKSIAGLRLNRANLDKKGFENDRRWMLVDQNGLFLSQRKDTALTRVVLEMGSEGQSLVLKDRLEVVDPIVLPLQAPSKSSGMKVQVWDDFCTALRAGQTYDDWFSAVIGKACHLVYMPDNWHRQVDLRYAQSSDQVSFADGFPFLLASQDSLADLNQRMDDPIEMIRFRPNLIISGNGAWTEDQWKSFSIGDQTFRSLKPCARCVLLTVNPETGMKGSEPLQTLSTFRKRNNKIFFGMNACWDFQSSSTGSFLEIGMEVKPIL